jgi:hypothetical protein
VRDEDRRASPLENCRLADFIRLDPTLAFPFPTRPRTQRMPTHQSREHGALTAVASTATIPRAVWALGFVSLFMDLSSELTHSLLPLFLVGTLGTSALTVGVIEGLAEATALIVKIFSGAISDFIGRRKDLLMLGYGLAALTKPPASWTGSAKAFAEHLGMRWWPMSRLPRFAVPALACDNRWTRWEHSSAHYWRYC